MKMEEIKSLVDKTSDDIVRYILDNDLEVGDKLPNEYELSSRLSVGRSTLREAVRLLVTRNILEVRQGAGTFVSSKKGVASDPLGFALVKDQDKMIRDLFELRYMVEPRMAALAAENATEQQLLELTRLKEDIERSFIEGTQEHVELDIAFHKKIAEASGNVALIHIIPIINQSIALFNESYNEVEMKLETIELHQELLEAISTRNAIQAFDAMIVHMSNNRKEFQRIIRKNNKS